MPTYGGGHVMIVVPTAKELLRRKDKPIIIGFAAAIPILEKSGLQYKTLKDYMFLFEKEKTEIMVLGERLAESNHNKHSDIDYIQTVLYYGISMYFLIKEKGEKEAWKKFNEENRKAFLPVEVLDRIIKFEKPDIVTATCNVRMELAGVLASKKNSIPSLYICDADYMIDNHEVLDYMTTFNEMHKKRYLDAGFNEKKLFVTGHPAFDFLFYIDQKVARKKIEKDFLVPERKKIILWISRQINNDIIKVYYEFLQLAKQNEDLFVIIKLHPVSQDISDFNVTDDDLLLQNFKVIKHYNTQELLAAADLVFVHDSTCGQEAILLNKKLVVINISSLYYGVRYADKNAAFSLDSLDGLESLTKKVLNNKKADTLFIEGRKQFLVEKEGAKNTVDLLHQICCL